MIRMQLTMSQFSTRANTTGIFNLTGTPTTDGAVDCRNRMSIISFDLIHGTRPINECIVIVRFYRHKRGTREYRVRSLATRISGQTDACCGSVRGNHHFPTLTASADYRPNEWIYRRGKWSLMVVLVGWLTSIQSISSLSLSLALFLVV